MKITLYSIGIYFTSKNKIKLFYIKSFCDTIFCVDHSDICCITCIF